MEEETVQDTKVEVSQSNRAGMKSYKDLDVWKKANALTLAIYTLTKTFPAEEVQGMCRQLRDTAISIPLLIAEAQAGKHAHETLTCLCQSKRSLIKLETLLQLSIDLGYIPLTEHNPVFNQIQDSATLIESMITYFESKQAIN